MRKMWWLLLILMVLAYPRASFAKAGDKCDVSSGPDYICVQNHLIGDREKSPTNSFIGSGPDFPPLCDLNETCVKEFAPDGLMGGKCIDPMSKLNDTSKELGNTASSTISGNDISKKCLLFSFICPADMFASFLEGASSSVSGLTGVNNDQTLVAFSCSRGFPSNYDPNTGKLDKTKLCTCLDPAPLASSGIKLLCARYASGMPEEAISGRWLGSKILDDVLNVSLPGIIKTGIENPPLSVDAEVNKKLTTLSQMMPDAKRKEQALRSVRSFAGCLTCANRGGYYSAIGCLPINDLGSFITTLAFQIGLGLAGAFCVLCMIYSAFMMQVSSGNSETIEGARKTLMSCLSGLVLIIFSIFIIRFIGVDILRIPGFGK